MMFVDSPPGSAVSEIDKYSPAGLWFLQLSKQLSLPSKPKAILIINAHWETKDIVNITAKKEHIQLAYDYEGYPPEAYQIKYFPPGDPNLSNRVKSLLEQAGIPAQLDDTKIIDHAVFFPLKLIYPDADIPVVAMSILDNLSPTQHIAIGKALSPLRKEEILIIGSGSVVHNYELEEERMNRFVDELTQVLTKSDEHERENVLINWEEKLLYSRLNHLREEHFIPLHIVVGAAGSDRGELLNPNIEKQEAAYKFGI